MTTLAVNALRQLTGKDRLRATRLVRSRILRISVVAEHALIRDQPARLRVMGIETRTHGPVAAAFGIPAQGKFDQRSKIRAMQVGSRMVAGPDDIIDLHLFDVGVASIEAGLPTPLVVDSVTNNH